MAAQILSELNDIEVVWRDLKAHHLAHQTFTDVDALDQAVHAAVQQLNRERMAVPLANLSILRLGKNDLEVVEDAIGAFVTPRRKRSPAWVAQF